MTKAEHTIRPEGMHKPPEPLGVFLDACDLHELLLRERTMAWNPRPRGSQAKGALSVPIHAWNDSMQESANMLARAGRLTMKDHRPRPTHAEAGNRVLYFAPDKEVEATMNSVNAAALQPLLGFMAGNPGLLESALVFPNATMSDKINGVVLTLNTRQGQGWKAARELGMPLGRGIELAALPMGIMEFWERSKEILPVVFEIARAEGGVKYIQFLFDEKTEQLFMSVAKGPRKEDVDPLNAGLSMVRKGADAQAYLGEVASRYASERQKLTQKIVSSLGLSGYESVFNSPYIGMDIDSGQVYSGAVMREGADNGLSPMTFANTELIVHKPAGRVVPVGVSSGDWSTKIDVPPGYVLPDPPKGHVMRTEISSVKDALDPAFSLRTTALAYHSKLRKTSRNSL